MKISNIEKICHWLIFITFLGLCCTAIAADYFFSKEAILESFKNSLPILNIDIAPSDQLFIARLERRNTWDIHLYFGIGMFIISCIWAFTNIVKKNTKYLILKILIFSVVLDLSISGIWMWQRLYFSLSEESFKLLKIFHHYGYWTLIVLIVMHVLIIVIRENKNKGDNLVSNMLRFKNTFLISLIIGLITPYSLKADSDMNNWTTDQNYLEGILYLEGSKGYETILKEITNCPYDKCKAADIDKKGFGTKNLEIHKPDFKKAIELLYISSSSGNALASNKLVQFLIKRIDYKSQIPDEYLVKQLKEETNLDYIEYKKLINKAIQNGITSNKSCVSEYYFGEILEYGILDNQKDIKKSQEHYKKAQEICPENNLYKMLANSKIKKI